MITVNGYDTKDSVFVDAYLCITYISDIAIFLVMFAEE